MKACNFSIWIFFNFRPNHLNLGQSVLSPRMASMDLQSISWTMREWELSTFQTLSHIRQLTLLVSSAGIDSWKLMRNLLMSCLLSRSNKKLKLGKGSPLALLSYTVIHSSFSQTSFLILMWYFYKANRSTAEQGGVRFLLSDPETDKYIQEVSQHHFSKHLFKLVFNHLKHISYT